MQPVRPATIADRDRLLAMVHALAAHHGDPPACTLAALDRDAFGADALVRLLVAEDGSAGPVGYAALCRTTQLQWGVHGLDMHHLFVERAARGTGIGAALVKATLAEARLLGCAYVSVGTHPGNTDAQAFYAQQGFQPRPHDPTRFVWRLAT
ncbi:MAG: GNAT family N-acetyltransferase [Pararhodobacter sp.]|nr:GNAT family N-acetyltransferase [Pararhodobacter sp.]